MFKSQSEIIEAMLAGLPYPGQIKDICLRNLMQVRFTWREARYVVPMTGHVDEVDGSCLVGSDRAILMRQVLVMAWAAKQGMA